MGCEKNFNDEAGDNLSAFSKTETSVDESLGQATKVVISSQIAFFAFTQCVSKRELFSCVLCDVVGEIKL